jgi:TolA-binding protein
MSDESGGIRARSEEAIGELAQALLENPLFSQALGRALGAGEKAAQAQKTALGALDVASAGDLERLTRRIRSLSDRVEELEDLVDDLQRQLEGVKRSTSSSA